MKQPVVYHDYDPYLLIAGTPNAEGCSKEFGRFKLNSLGFRSAEIGEKRGFRVVVVGGSAVWGSGASDNQATFPAQLERALRERHGLSIEVINAGVGGYCSFQELILIAHRVVYLLPDLVILFDGYNDAHSIAQISEQAYVHNEVQTYTALKTFLVKNTKGKDFTQMAPLSVEVLHLCRRLPGARGLAHLAREMRSRLTRAGLGAFIPAMIRDVEVYGLNLKGVKTYLTNVQMIVDILLGQRVSVLVALQPYLPLSRKTMTVSEKEWAAREKAKRGKIEAIENTYRLMECGLRELAKAKEVGGQSFVDVFDEQRQTCFADHVHPTDLGYRVIGERLAELVAARVRR